MGGAVATGPGGGLAGVAATAWGVKSCPGAYSFSALGKLLTSPRIGSASWKTGMQELKC